MKVKLINDETATLENAKKANCYKCKFRKDFSPGDVHSRCNIAEDPRDEILLTVFRPMIVLAETKIPAVGLSPHGVAMGWAIWPLNFDPVWVEHCFFFTSNEKENINGNT